MYLWMSRVARAIGATSLAAVTMTGWLSSTPASAVGDVIAEFDFGVSGVVGTTTQTVMVPTTRDPRTVAFFDAASMTLVTEVATTLRAYGNGSVAMVGVADDGSTEAYARDGSLVWSQTTEGDAVAALADGTLVFESCSDASSSCELLAIDTDGRERWRMESPPRARVVREPGEHVVLRPHVVLRQDDDIRDADDPLLLVDPTTGERTSIGTGDRAVVGDDFVATLQPMSSGECSLVVYELDGRQRHRVTDDCTLMSSPIVDLVGTTVSFQPSSSTRTLLDATSGDVWRFDLVSDDGTESLTRRMSASGFLAGGEDSLTLAPSVGAEPVVSVKGNWGVGGSTAEAFVVTRTVWPDDDAVGDGGIDEIVVYDPVSGEQCATVSLPHSEFPRSIDGLPGCRALVTVPGPSTLLLGRS